MQGPERGWLPGCPGPGLERFPGAGLWGRRQTRAGTVGQWGQGCCLCSPSELSWRSCLPLITAKTGHLSLQTLVIISAHLLINSHTTPVDGTWLRHFICKETATQAELWLVRGKWDVKIHWKLQSPVQGVWKHWRRGRLVSWPCGYSGQAWVWVYTLEKGNPCSFETQEEQCPSPGVWPRTIASFSRGTGLILDVENV